MKIEQNETAVKFLLGKLSEEEQTKIEEDFFKDNALFEDIRITENDLIDAYVAGSLSSDDRRRFENRLLLNPEQRQRVEFAETLFRYTSNQNLSNDELTILPAKPEWWTFISQLLTVKPMFSLAFAATALVSVSFGVWWAFENKFTNSPQVNQTDELAQVKTPEPFQNQVNIDETNNETSVENQPTPVLQPSPKAAQQQPSPKKQIERSEQPRTIISTIILPFGATRDVETAKIIEIPAKADLIKIQLKFEEGDFASYSAVLETVEGRQIWSQKMLKTAKGKTDKAVTLAVPSPTLKKGDYIITLKGLTKEGTYEKIGDYSFTISRR